MSTNIDQAWNQLAGHLGGSFDKESFSGERSLEGSLDGAPFRLTCLRAWKQYVLTAHVDVSPDLSFILVRRNKLMALFSGSGFWGTWKFKHGHSTMVDRIDEPIQELLESLEEGRLFADEGTLGVQAQLWIGNMNFAGRPEVGDPGYLLHMVRTAREIARLLGQD